MFSNFKFVFGLFKNAFSVLKSTEKDNFLLLFKIPFRFPLKFKIPLEE